LITGEPNGLLPVTLVGGAGAVPVTLNGLEITAIVPTDACKVSPVPAALIERFAKVAIPVASVCTVSAPLSTPGPEFSVKVMETPGSTAP